MSNYADILLLNRSFWPDIEATGQFLTELCEAMAKKYSVCAIVGRSYYFKEEKFLPFWPYAVETRKGIRIIRVRHTRFWKGNLAGRFINWFTYGVLSFFAAMVVRPRLIIACTDPPFIGIIAMLIRALKRRPFIYNVRDLYPDVAVALGKLKAEGFVSRAFDSLNKMAFNSAIAVVCAGESMADRLSKKGLPTSRITVIPEWVDIDLIRPVAKTENPLREKFSFKDKFVIMHSGNIGLSQDFDLIIEALRVAQGEFSFWTVIIGGGAGEKRLRYKIASANIKDVLFLPYQPREMLSFSIGMGDLHLITLKKGMAGAICPSKVYGIMAAGRPYLAVTDRESEPARAADECGCGLWAAPDDLNAISEGIKWAIKHPAELEEMGRAGRRIAETKFDKTAVINRWFELLVS